MSEESSAAAGLSLGNDGRILWQPGQNNPLPGQAVATINKGESVLAPVVSMEPTLPDGAPDRAAVEAWLTGHIEKVLEPLMALHGVQEQPEPVQKISARLYQALGILPREELEDQIALLDSDTRRILRNLKIKLGPVLVFLPDLNKPAAVRMRALLWGLYHGKPLPMSVPADGIVSLKVEGAIDPVFYRTIGYPVYGPRAVRIDMLDRVIISVYDSAKEGKFQARHEMAEWLGSSIEDLYLVLEAMGHKKIHDPADEQKEDEEEAEKKASEEKPELATFRLKKGRASETSAERSGKKPAGKKPDRKKAKKKPEKKDHKKDRGPRVISAAPKQKPEDSPFAVLEQLKTKSDGQ